MNLTSDCILSHVQSSMLELKHLIFEKSFPGNWKQISSSKQFHTYGNRHLMLCPSNNMLRNLGGVGFFTAFSFCNCSDGVMALADETTLNSELTWVIYFVQYIPPILIVSSGLFIYETSERK